MKENVSSVFRNKWFIIAAVTVIAVICTLVYIYSARMNLLDESEYKEIYKLFTTCKDEGGFESQEEMRDFIVKWAEDNEVACKVDKYGNIIFNTPAVKRKKNVSPTLVCCGYNYETAFDYTRALVTAMITAKTDLQSGRKTVILCNDERNEGLGYRHISKKLLTDKTKVIYLDYGSSSYISCSSFAECFSYINVPASRVDAECDTAVKVHISGVTSGEVTNNLSKHPDVISAFSTLMSRLKSKSTVFQLADVEIGDNGNMYPVSMDAVFMLNSYNVSSFTKFIEQRSKAWQKSYGDTYEELEYTYEVIDDPDDLPKKAYSTKSTDKLASVLYTLKSGIYKYEKDDDIPEDKSYGETCGLNYLLDIKASSKGFDIYIMTQGYNKSFISKIQEDDKTVAKLYKCQFDIDRYIPRFVNNKDSLVRNLRNTHSKLNSADTMSTLLEVKSDNYFTPCSYIKEINDNADIVHLRLNKDNAIPLTNTILCYIKTKGNIISL
jgi:hypothetical protein